MLPIAVVIPTLNEAERIGSLLRQLSAMDFAEIVVADGGSSDGTGEIAARQGGRVRTIRTGRGRGLQINAGVRSTTAPILLVLHADTELPAGGPASIRGAFLEPDIVAGCFRLCFDTKSPMLDLYAWFSRYESALTTFGDQGFFFRRTAFDAVGGAPDWPFLEDVALRERLKRAGRFVKRPEVVITSARRFAKQGPLLTQLRNLLILAGYRCGVPVDVLARAYASVR